MIWRVDGIDGTDEWFEKTTKTSFAHLSGSPVVQESAFARPMHVSIYKWGHHKTRNCWFLSPFARRHKLIWAEDVSTEVAYFCTWTKWAFVGVGTPFRKMQNRRWAHTGPGHCERLAAHRRPLLKGPLRGLDRRKAHQHLPGEPIPVHLRYHQRCLGKLFERLLQ